MATINNITERRIPFLSEELNSVYKYRGEVWENFEFFELNYMEAIQLGNLEGFDSTKFSNDFVTSIVYDKLDGGYFYFVTNFHLSPNYHELQIINVNHQNIIRVYNYFEERPYKFQQLVSNERLNTVSFPKCDVEPYVRMLSVLNRTKIDVGRVYDIMDRCSLSFYDFENLLEGETTSKIMLDVIRVIMKKQYDSQTYDDWKITMKPLITNVICEAEHHIKGKKAFVPHGRVVDYLTLEV